MALSDEDYGILCYAIGAAETNDEDWLRRNIVCLKTIFHNLIPEAQTGTLQQYIDFAAFIILSEGRELP